MALVLFKRPFPDAPFRKIALKEPSIEANYFLTAQQKMLEAFTEEAKKDPEFKEKFVNMILEVTNSWLEAVRKSEEQNKEVL